MTTNTTIRGLFATALLLGATAAPAFAQGTGQGGPVAAPPASANRPAATAPNNAVPGPTGATTPNRPTATAPALAPAAPNSAAQRPAPAPAERQGSAVAPGAGGNTAPSGPARTN